ncbi:MAG: ATP-binding protein [bacterium]
MNEQSAQMNDRWVAQSLSAKLARPYVHILFGARQTGKSTLINALLPDDALALNFADPGERNQHLSQPGLFVRMCQALPARKRPHTVFVDEAQNVPSVFDAVQSLFDTDKNRWRFILCGSSARKLRKTGTNLLPGRSFIHHLFPLILTEQPPPAQPPASAASPLALPWKTPEPHRPFPAWDIEERLAFGALPGIVTADAQDRAELLRAYAIAFLEEEIRREALVKDWGAFLRFLQLAARESGQMLNYSVIAREVGLSIPTVKSHYQLLEDMFIGFTIPAFSGSARRNLLSTPRFCFFDLGIRNAAAGLTPGADIVSALAGPLFEQWVGIELWKRLQYNQRGRLHFLRTEDGAEVDYVIETDGKLIPIEVKWTERPSPGDARHLKTFIHEHPKQATQGWLICRCPHAVQISDNITAIPWAHL